MHKNYKLKMGAFVSSNFFLVLSLILILSISVTCMNCFPKLIMAEKAGAISSSINLFTKVKPPILTTGNRQDAYMQFRLFDANNNKTIQHVTYEITVIKGTTSSSNQKPLLRDFFHAHNGLLTLNIQPANGTLTIYGEQDPFTNAWLADPDGTVNIKGPVLLEGGIYHLHVEIFGIDNDKNIFVPEDAPKFDTDLLVHNVKVNDLKLGATTSYLTNLIPCR
jgi:hypothetical protein